VTQVEGAHRENAGSKSSPFTPRAARGRVGRHTRGLMSSAPPLSTPLALARVAHVADALLACVAPTFGVAGKDRWIRNARNQIVITNSGEAVLRAVTVDHPVATYLREVITTHAERHGDGAVSTLAMVTAGVKRVAELCGGDDVHGDARRKRTSLARALSRLADGALRTTLLPLAIDAATVRVPVPGFENDDELVLNSGWDPSDRFRAGARATAATALAGAAAPATRAALATLAVTLVASTVREVSRVDFEKRTAALRDALRDLRARPPVVAARGASVEASALLRGVLCAGSLARVSVRRREDRDREDRFNPSSDERENENENKINGGWISDIGYRSVSRGVDAPARVAALRGVELDDPFFGNDGASATFAYADGDEFRKFENGIENGIDGVRSGTDSELRARAFAARSRAEILASRGVDLVVSQSVISRRAASALADVGVFALELVSENDFDALLGALRIAPARAATTRALRTCDVGVAAGGFRERSAGPGLETFTHVRTDASFVACVRGFSAETAEANAEALRRAVRVAARAFVVTDAEASMHLVPGGGACEAALFAAARAAAARATGAFPENENGVLDARDDGGAASLSRASRESDAAALDVLCAMARAVPDALASLGREGRNDRGASDGILDPGSTVQSVGRSFTRGGATDVLAAATDARDSARDFFSSGGSFTKKENREASLGRRALVGLVSAAVAPETAHPGTAAAILDEAPPAFASGEDDKNARRVAAYAHAAADPVAFAVLEPAETKRAAVVAAVEAVAQTTRIEQIVRARARGTSAAARIRRQRKKGKKDASDESSSEDESSDASCPS